jgi:hypothetical protein
VALTCLLVEQYTAHATARGKGRNGEVESHDDASLKLRLAMPKSLGGKGDGQNPEQLFAMGYAGARSGIRVILNQVLTLVYSLLPFRIATGSIPER